MADTPPIEQQVDDGRAALGKAVSERLSNASGVRIYGDDRARIYAVPQFLDDDECIRLMAMIDETAMPSDIFKAEGYDNYRTSHSGNLDRENAFVRTIDERIDALLGMDYPHGETIQGQRYAEGEYFRLHADFFYISEPYWPDMERCGGQRTWTAMAYLNEPERGGATKFDRLGVKIAPERGLLLAWNNMDVNGAPNEWTMHQGTPVHAGTKYIITKWYRERPWYRREDGAVD